jgi:hypothetical protein
MAKGWERVELYPRAEDEECMTFTVTRSIFPLRICMLDIPRGFSFSGLLDHTAIVWKINRRAMTTEIPNLMEAVLCNIKPGRCKP